MKHGDVFFLIPAFEFANRQVNKDIMKKFTYHLMPCKVIERPGDITFRLHSNG